MEGSVNDDQIIARALRVLDKEIKARDCLASPAAVRSYLKLKLGRLEHEVFGMVFLTAQNAAITYEELFRGTISQTSVYPREVVKTALRYNAAAVIAVHNHPSGVCEPSIQDQSLTRTLKEALAMVDVRLLDHFIVSGPNILSMAERGLV